MGIRHIEPNGYTIDQATGSLSSSGGSCGGNPIVDCQLLVFIGFGRLKLRK